MNRAQLDARKKANEELGIWISNKVADLQTKGFTKKQAYARYDAKVNQFLDEKETLDRAASAIEAGDAFTKKLGGNPGDLGSEPDITLPLGSKALGATAFPLGLPKQELKDAFKAIKRGQPCAIEAKAYSSASSLLPAHLAPGIIPEYHEHRLLDHLPVTSITAPSYEFVIHTFGSDTGGPDFVAEAAAKPEYVPAVSKSVVTAEKLAVHTGISTESLQDAPQWESYVINQVYRLIMDKENHALLYGTGSNNQILGLANTSGILTHDHSGDGATVTNLDAIEIAINTMRIQSGVFAVPTIAVTSPTTWSATRRIKSTTNEYIAGDPLHDAVTTVWGVPVITTTAVNDGEMFIIDSSKYGSVLVREGLSMHTGYSGTDLIDNIVRFVFEERLAQATVIPSAVCQITNLATS